MMVGLWGIGFLDLLLIGGAVLMIYDLPERYFFEGEVAVIEL